jgi:hypothetical protein
MSFDTLVSLALFLGALFLMMRFGCGAHMGHARNHDRSTADRTRGGAIGSNSGEAVGASVATLNSATGPLPVNGATPEKAAEGRAHRHGCC